MIFLKNMNEFFIWDIAGGNPKKFFGFIPDDKRIYKVTIFRNQNALVFFANIKNFCICGTIFVCKRIRMNYIKA